MHDARPVPSKRARIENFLLIIGAMKSGTTTLFHYLSQHPQLCPSRRKEPNFFGNEERWSRGRKFYRQLWRNYDPSVHRYAFEASTHYTKNRTDLVARRIAATKGNFSFIYILRDPIDRIESHISYNMAHGADLGEEKALSPRFVGVSRYADQIDKFRAALGDPRMLLLDFEELARDPIVAVNRCVDFLGIDPFPFEYIGTKNKTTAVSSSARFNVSDQQREILKEELKPDVRRLRDVYGFDVSRWSVNPD